MNASESIEDPMTIIGFGIRVPIAPSARGQRLSTVLCPTKPMVLSIDTNVWRVLSGPQANRSYIEDQTWAFCELWYDVDILRRYCDSIGLSSKYGCLIAIGASPVTMAILRSGGWDTPIARPSRLGSTGIDWVFLGYDITDPDFYSHLCSTGWARSQGSSQAVPDLCGFLNDYHLCATMADAAVVIATIRQSPGASGHQPPLPFALFMSKQW